MNNLRFLFWFFISIWLVHPSFAKKSNDFIIKVNNQAEFDNLPLLIEHALNQDSKRIRVQFCEGVFYFNEEHVSLKNLTFPDKTLVLEGNLTTFIGAGQEKESNTVKPDFHYGYFDKENRKIDFWEGIFQANDTVEIVDKANKICRLKAADPYVGNKKGGKSHILLTRWFVSSIYPIVKVEDGYYYFMASDLKKTTFHKMYNVNGDYGFAKKYPRYKIFHCKDTSSLFECRSSNFLTIDNCQFKTLKLKGFSFCGNSSMSSSLLKFNDVHGGELLLSDCTFEAIKNRVLLATLTDNLYVCDCVVSECDVDGFVSENGCKNTVIENCFFQRNGQRLNNTACVICRGGNFIVRNNTFVDFSYSAISVGMNYQWDKKYICSGIVERNNISYSDEYLSHPEKYTLMDGGAIYVMTQQENIEIRYNCIHGYTGVWSNRGIFCDDGTKNVKISGNVVTGVPNSFSIDLRLVSNVSTRVPDHNTGNVMEFNIMDSKFRFQGRKDLPESISEHDNLITRVSYDGEKYRISSETQALCKKWSCWKEIKTFFRIQ